MFSRTKSAINCAAFSVETLEESISLMRPLLLNAEANRLLGPAAQFARVDDNGSIGIFNVLQRSLSETAAFQLLNWIAIWNPAEFIETSSWTPTAGLDSMF